jgi:hypothetical protein
VVAVVVDMLALAADTLAVVAEDMPAAEDTLVVAEEDMPAEAVVAATLVAEVAADTARPTSTKISGGEA